MQNLHFAHATKRGVGGGAAPSLPDVLLQLVMQCCDQSMRFTLARCNRDTMRAASHVAAWKYLSPISMTTTFVGFNWPILRGLIRFIETDVTTHCAPYDILRQLPRIRAVRFTTTTSNAEVNRMSAMAALAHVHTMDLSVRSNVPSVVLPTSVHTLRLFGHCHPNRLDAIPSMPNLTHLDLSNTSQYPDEYADVVRSCNRLRVLSLRFGSPASLRTMLMDRLPNLHTLILHRFFIGTGDTSAFACLMNRTALQHVLFHTPYQPGQLASEWINQLSSRDANAAATCSLRTLRLEGVFSHQNEGKILLQIAVEHVELLLRFSATHLRFELGLPELTPALISTAVAALFPDGNNIPWPTLNEIRERIRTVWQPMVALDPTRVFVTE